MEYKEYIRIYNIIREAKDIAVTNQDFNQAATIRSIEAGFFLRRKDVNSNLQFNWNGHKDFNIEFFDAHIRNLTDRALSRDIKLKILGM